MTSRRVRAHLSVFLCWVAAATLTTAQEAAPKEPEYDVAPELIQQFEADYPDEARDENIEGEVILKIRVEVDGTTSVLSIIKALGYGCDEAASEAAHRWTWKSALRDGAPVEATGIIVLKFPARPDGPPGG